MEENEMVNNNEEKDQVKKPNFFNKIGQGLKKAGEVTTKFAKDVGKFIDDKVIEPTKENIAIAKEKKLEQEALQTAFKKQSEEFFISYLDKTKKAKSIYCINDEDNHLLKTNFDIINPTEVECIRDIRKQGYFSIRVKSSKSKFKINYNNKELELDLFNVEYSKDKPKEEVPTTYIDNRIDNSINAGKGSIVGNDNDVSKQTKVDIGLNLPKL